MQEQKTLTNLSAASKIFIQVIQQLEKIIRWTSEALTDLK